MSMFASLHRSPSAAQLTSDASGGWDCGAYISTGQWFQLQWPESWESVHITVKELVPIVVACALWGNTWTRKTIRCRCDNAAVVAIVRSGTSKYQLVMHLMRCLFFFVAVYQVYLEPVHYLPIEISQPPTVKCVRTPLGFQPYQRSFQWHPPNSPGVT